MKAIARNVFIFSLVALILLFGPLYYFDPGNIGDLGGYLTGVAAFIAALKFITPYILVFIFKEVYFDEILWEKFYLLEDETQERRTEVTYLAGIINFFNRVSDEVGNNSNDHWYRCLPSIADNLYFRIGEDRVSDPVCSKHFESAKKLLQECAHIVSMNSTLTSPIRDEVRGELGRQFKNFVSEMKFIDDKITRTPAPIRKLIEENNSLSSFFTKKNKVIES